MWLSEQARVVLDRIALGGRVNDREHLPEVVEDEAEVEDRVLLGHAGHERVFRERVLAARVLLVGSSDLVIQRLDVGREEAVEVEGVAFEGCEARAFVVVGCAEEIAALGICIRVSPYRKSVITMVCKSERRKQDQIGRTE